VSETDRPELRGWPRVVSLAAIVLAIFAGTIFIVIIVLGSGGDTSVSTVFGPIAIAATALGLVAGVAAVVPRRSRVLGVLALLILAPCVLLSLLNLVALTA
jgi:hypothetical protein